MDTTRPSLLIRVKDRSDRAAWQTFDEIYRPLLVRYAERHGLAHSDAEDIAQDCLEGISRRIESFEYDPSRGRFKSWLGTLVRNRVRNWLRRGRRPSAGEAALADASDDSPGPDEAFERVWLEQHLWHCLRELERDVEPATYRAFVASVIEERPIEEVSTMTGLTVNNLYTIKWRLTQRIAARMRELTDADG